MAKPIPDCAEPDKPPEQRRPTPEDMPGVMEDIAEGASLREACRNAGLHAPSTHAFIHADPALSEQYARAKDQRADYYAERGLRIGIEVYEGKGEPDRARVALDAIKWATGRMSPKSGEVKRVSHSFEDMTPEERRARIAELQAELADGSGD